MGEGVLVLRGDEAFVRVERADRPGQGVGIALTLVAAVPKGDRADWMVEKLSELGVAEFVPLAAARSVVLPGGKGKRERWLRIATEAAKQSRRAGVMRVTELTSVNDAVRRCKIPGGGGGAWFLSTEVPGSTPAGLAVQAVPAGGTLTAFIGPEGGWAPKEVEQFTAAGVTAVRLTSTILRVETAAVATAALVACLGAGAPVRVPLDGPPARDDDPAATNASTTGTPP